MPVIVGNPPWSNFGRQNSGPWIKGLLADYRVGLDERKSNLADDFIKFVRWGQHWIDQAGRGIVVFITPNTWLDGLTHRRMRQSLLQSFDEMLVVDLHGEADREDDENVFGVRSGVAVVVLVKGTSEGDKSAARGEYSVLSTQYLVPGTRQSTVIRHDLYGTRPDKLRALEHHHSPDRRDRRSTRLPPSGRLPQPASGRRTITTRSGRWTGSFASTFPACRPRTTRCSWASRPARSRSRCRPGWRIRTGPPSFDPALVRPYLVAPFDRRWIYYDPRLIGRARLTVMRHMLRPNLGLVFMRQATGQGEYDHFLAVDALVSDRVFYSRRGAPFLAPLWGEEGTGQESEVRSQESSERANFDAGFLAAMEAVVGQRCDPLAVFGYLYAIGWCREYRERFAERLRRGFPRLPLPPSGEAFVMLAELGKRLVELHVMDRGPEASLPPAVGEECR